MAGQPLVEAASMLPEESREAIRKLHADLIIADRELAAADWHAQLATWRRAEAEDEQRRANGAARLLLSVFGVRLRRKA